MTPKKIAVCLSGQTRLWKMAQPSILNYFSSDVHEYHFFGHAWDENGWKTMVNGERDYINEQLDIKLLKKEIEESSIEFDELVVDRQWHPPIDRDWRTWTSMLRSESICNFLKRKYEVENDMLFDIVVRTRWDVVFQPCLKFETFVNDFLNVNVLYCNLMNDFNLEFRLPAIDDVMYFGSSRVMNIMSSMYLPYVNTGLPERWKADDDNLAFLFVGCGVLLHRWATLHNIAMVEPRNFAAPIVLRKTLDDLKWPDDYGKMNQNFIGFLPV